MRLSHRFAIRSKCGAIALAVFAASTVVAAGDGRATFIDSSGKRIGKALPTETRNGLLIHVELRGLPAGVHGFHIHEAVKCDRATAFKSAGGHFAPANRRHGYRAGGGPHAGDMPNGFVGSDDLLNADIVIPRVTPAGASTGLLDADGSALVVHARADDYGRQPSGNAGDRLACAVIRR